MILDVKPENFYRFKWRDGPFMVLYSYENNFFNRLLVAEIEKTEKKYLNLKVLKINWLEQKNFSKITDDTECNRVVLYYKKEKIFDYCPPDLEIHLPKMFQKHKELYDFETIKNSQSYISREINVEKYSSLKIKKNKYISKILNCENFSNSNNYKTGCLVNGIKVNFPKNISQRQIVQKINSNIAQRDNSENNFRSKMNMNTRSFDYILNDSKEDKCEILPNNRILMKYYFQRFCRQNSNQSLKNKKIGFYSVKRWNTRFISNKKSKNGNVNNNNQTLVKKIKKKMGI